MSALEQPKDLSVRVQPPDDALKTARPLPRIEHFMIEDVTDAEWDAFQEALADV